MALVEPNIHTQPTTQPITSSAATEKVGVLLLNLGGPDTLEQVEPFLYNLFSDPEIITLPRQLGWLNGPLAWVISKSRAPSSRQGYEKVLVDGSPQTKTTLAQGRALEQALARRGVAATSYVGMRYWDPYVSDALAAIKRDGVERLVVLPLYPQFSISTSGSSLRLLEEAFRADPYLSKLPHTVIPSWYQRPGYVGSMAKLIMAELDKFVEPEEVRIFFSAHGVPVSYVEEAGDPYKEEMEECIELIMQELKRRGCSNPHTLAYQSRVGPVQWLQPYTDDSLRELGAAGCKSLLAVPISFVSEHIETLEEIDIEYREVAEESGIVNWGRVPALGTEPTFISDLADAVLEALPYARNMAATMPATEAPPALVPIGSVEDLLAAYDRERLELPAPVEIWEWGWTASAEKWNGRLAMLGIFALLFAELATGSGVLSELGVSLPPAN